MKPNCFECKYMGENAGTANIRCLHPAFKEINEIPLLQLMGILGSVGRVPPIQVKNADIVVVGDPHGIKNHWFSHPFSFDPVWLISCTGFVKKEAKKRSKKID